MKVEIYLDQDLKNEIDANAKKENLSRSSFLRNLITKTLHENAVI